MVVGAWLVALLLMGVAGLGAKDVLEAEDLVIRGTQSAAALETEEQAFGKTSPIVVSLEGPPAQIETHGPRLVRSLKRINGTTVASPWAAGAPELLREEPNRALLIVHLPGGVIDSGNEVLPQVQARIATLLPASIDSHVAGQPRFSTELVELVFSGAQKAELYALPILLLILLLIFRTPLAAAVPLGLGVAVIVVTTGLVTLLGRVMPVNVLAQASGSIIGLALGVDYSLLFVSRFRDELRERGDVAEAVRASLDSAGRTILFAGGILACAGLVVIAVTFGWASMTTGSIGVITAALIAVLASYSLLPALLMLIGRNVDRWPIGSINTDSRLAPWVARVVRRPALAAVLSLIPLIALCGAALGLQTGGPDPQVFDRENPMRVDVEAVSDRYGGGVLAPWTVLVQAEDGPVTSPENIRNMQRFQNSLSDDPAVRRVVGPGTQRVRDAGDGAEQLAGLTAASSGVEKLRRGVDDASDGASALAAANQSALGGARQLQAGAEAAANGAGALSSGIGDSASGSRRLESALQQLSRGADRLNSAGRSGRKEAQSLAANADTLLGMVSRANGTLAGVKIPDTGSATSQLDAAIAALDGLPPAVQSEPGVQSARSSLVAAKSDLPSSGGDSLSSAQTQFRAIESAVSLGKQLAGESATDFGRLADGLSELAGGAEQAAGGSSKLSSGLGQLEGGSGRLAGGLAPLAGGSRSLADGLGQAGAGAGELSSGLQRGYKRSGELEDGLGGIGGAADLRKVGSSPHMTMALLAAAPADQRENLRLVLNDANGGTTARIMVFTDAYPTDKSMQAFAARIDKQAALLQESTGTEVSVGGPGRTFLDYDDFTRSRIVPLMLAMGLMSLIFLLVAFRSPVLAIKAVLLNTITVGAAMGAIDLLYGGNNPLFGGPGWMEATSFFVVFSTVFALSMDYEIFMINRMRESYAEHGSNERAIEDGIAKTAGIVTGSAAVMCVLFVAMALTSNLVSSAQLGLGLAIAIAIDATLVRLVLLPASMHLLGRWNWWLPSMPDLRRLRPRTAG